MEKSLVPVGQKPTFFYRPFAGYVQGGFPSPASDYMEEGINLNKDLNIGASTFFMRVQGESMIDAHIPPDAILVIDKAIKPKNNSIVIAVVNGEFTVKYFVRDFKGCTLHPANPKFQPIRITEDMQFEVWGVVTAVIIETK
jgi:DNA polymerase V